MQRRTRLPATLSPACRLLLGPERAEIFDRLMDPETGNPRELMAALRDDPGFGQALVECDTVDRLGPMFSRDRGDWTAESERSGALGDASFGVAWTFATRHTEPDAFNHLPATNRPVTVRGFTILGVDVDPDSGDEKVKVRRYVDWAGVFGQLGLTLNWRVPLPN